MVVILWADVLHDHLNRIAPAKEFMWKPGTTELGWKCLLLYGRWRRPWHLTAAIGKADILINLLTKGNLYRSGRGEEGGGVQEWMAWVCRGTLVQVLTLELQQFLHWHRFTGGAHWVTGRELPASRLETPETHVRCPHYVTEPHCNHFVKAAGNQTSLNR